MSTTTQHQLKGPKPLPVIGNVHQFKVNEIHQFIEDCRLKYGANFKMKIGPKNLTVITDETDIKFILKNRPTIFRRAPKLDEVLQEANIQGVFNAEGEEWKKQRKIVAQGLDQKHLDRFYPIIELKTKLLEEKWKESVLSNDTVSVQKDLFRYTVDVTTELVFGLEMNTLNAKGGVIQDHTEPIFPTIFKRINSPFPLHKIYKTKSDKAFDRAVNGVTEFGSGLISDVKEKLGITNNESEVKHFLHALIEEIGTDSFFSDDKVLSNLLTMLLAGEDTTAHSLAWALSFMVEYPEWQEKLFVESASIKTPTKDNLAKLRLLDAFIKESMRLRPVAPILLFQALKDGETDNGYKFYHNELFILQLRAAAMDECNFTNAKEFYPYRWLKEEGCPVHNELAYAPFGAGPRFCPGMNLAYMEMRAVLYMIVQNFRVVKGDSYSTPKENMAFTMMPTDMDLKLIER